MNTVLLDEQIEAAQLLSIKTCRIMCATTQKRKHFATKCAYTARNDVFGE